MGFRVSGLLCGEITLWRMVSEAVTFWYLVSWCTQEKHERLGLRV